MSIKKDENIIYQGDIEESMDNPSLGDFLVQRFKAGGNKVALINGFTEEKWSYNDILTESIKVSRALHGAGINRNDVVAVLSESRLEYASISYGIMFLNAIVAPTNTEYTKNELIHSLSISTPRFIFISALAIKSLEIVKQLKFVEKIILLDEVNIDNGRQISFREFLQKYGSNNFDVENSVRKSVDLFDQVAVIFMSSGTTGLPKGVELTHGNLLACAVHGISRVKVAQQFFDKIIVLSITPWHHAMGFMGKFLTTTSSETTQVFLHKFEPRMYLKCVEKYRIFTLNVPPPVILFLAKTPLFYEYDLSSIVVITSGAAPLSKELENEVKKRFNNGLIVIQAYGQTEATLGLLYCELANAKPGSVGLVIKGTKAKVVDSNGNSLGPNKVGELCFKGPMTMKGYRNNPKATAEVIDKDGWLHTGDIGYYDEDKHFFIVDRQKELIKYNAYQVPPAEIEGLLVSHPKIKDSGVIGIPDERAGELPFAFVVKEQNSDLTEQMVQDHVAKNLSNPKWLRGGVKFIDEIPKNPSGKILRRELKELFKMTKAKL